MNLNDSAPPAQTPPRVSLCITCQGRLHHLRETLPANLRDNADWPRLEFVLLDYTSRDGLMDWARETLAVEIHNHRLAYHRAEGCAHYFSAHAKNAAARLATGDIVCNLDADNFTGPGFARFLAEFFPAPSRRFLSPAKKGGGLDGRIAFWKTEFESLGGYDERFTAGYGWDDDDLKSRAVAAGFTRCAIPEQYLDGIQHEDAERVANFACRDKTRSRDEHKRLSDAALAAGEFTANRGRAWGVLNQVARLRLDGA